MQVDVMTSVEPQPVHGYARAAVDDFCAAARAERTRLETAISDAESRARRARAAVGMHRVMVSMLLETQRELAELRNSAEAEAAEIIGNAEEEARELVRAAQDETIVAPGAAMDRNEPASAVVEEPDASIDLTAVEREEQRQEEQRVVHPSNSASSASLAPVAPRFDTFTNTQADDQFFAYLRGALADERPLGPGFE